MSAPTLTVHFRPEGGLPRQIKQRPATPADVRLWLLDQGAEERQWCQQHKQDGDEVGCLGAHMVGTACRMVSVLVWRQ